MQMFQCKVLFVLLFTIYCVNCGRPGPNSVNYDHLRNKECLAIQKELKSAKAEAAKSEAFRKYLISINIIIKPDQPGYLFFNNIPLRNDLIKIYHDASIVYELSKKVAKRLYKGKLPQTQNINPLLRKNTCCVEDFFKRFCVDNKHYKCPKNQKYRSIDGYCTSPYRPKDGASSTTFVSFLYQYYDDSFSKLRTEARTCNILPSPRELSNTFFDRCQSNNNNFLKDGPSVAGAQFGALLALDSVALAYPRGDPSLTCCKKDYSTVLPKSLLHKSCAPFRIPKDDTFFGPRGITCMNFLRAQPAYDNDCVFSSRKQLNTVTSAVDLSFIYGSVAELAISARSFSNGLLKTNAANLFPEDASGNFMFTDFRAVATPVIALLNVLFIREHNRIACALKSKYHSWDDEKLFQEARRWNIAQFQYILYEWIDIFIPNQYKYIRMTNSKKANVTCATSNEFGVGVLRQHHCLISETVSLFDKNGNLVQDTLLGESDTSDFIRNSFSKLTRSLFYQKVNYNGCHNQIRNQLFANTDGVGMDLFAFDIKRGRDHGLQPYYKYAELCMKIKIKSFEDLKFLISDENIKKLRKIYDSVYDIDLYIGVYLEKRPKPYQFGLVGSCIANEQFYRYRRGDSFFYNNSKQNYPFTEIQLAEIQKASFSRILCDNGGITSVAKNAFWAQSSLNPIVNCDQVPTVNVLC